MKAKDESKLLMVGFNIIIALQTTIILGGVLNLIPLTGITLPFISYGGSSIISMFIMFGIMQKLLEGEIFMNKNLKIISFMFSFLFLVIISSFNIFLVFRSTYYSNHSLNKRISQERSKFIRGKILDRDGNVVAYTTEDGQKRIYPYGEALVHPIGYADIKYGMSGIENDMDEYLREPRGFISSIKSFFGYEDVHGSDVKLTIDSELQSYAYESLGNNKGAIVVMNPKTGEIYALVSKPSFDPNNLNEIWDSLIMEGTAPLYNRAINGKYPPGSTF